MAELMFRNENPTLPYRVYLPLSLAWALKGLEHLTPDKADLGRLPADLPEPVQRAIECFVNDAKAHQRWFCIKDGDLDDDQDEDILQTAAFHFMDEEGQHLIVDYIVHDRSGYHGPSPLLIKLLCGEN